jgi:hypothetical protein
MLSLKAPKSMTLLVILASLKLSSVVSDASVFLNYSWYPMILGQCVAALRVMLMVKHPLYVKR